MMASTTPSRTLERIIRSCSDGCFFSIDVTHSAEIEDVPVMDESRIHLGGRG
jgi:hypothetical protein